ncbi:WD repeat-containing protein 37 [Argiope bruennichi]|uniref:WD repeat-containing protein 37 n=1 Tax=Argiope bruennichi TaxID=94029 RepID=A0A8T0E3X4_ARGBR|nr:WD repeat-containing protein 37 [Argiope bruennichi]
MPLEMQSSKSSKGKRIKSFGRVSSSADPDFPLPYNRVDDGDVILPIAFRGRLYELFSQIEKEFEALYTENIALKDKIEALNEQLEREPAAAIERTDTFDSGEPSVVKTKGKRESITASQLSQKIKSTYKLKASTSRIVSTFKAPSLACRLFKEYLGHRDGVWEVSCSRHGPALIATASADHTAKIWDIHSGNCIVQYWGHKGSVNSIRFHPSQDLVVSSSGDQTAHVWCVSSAGGAADNLKYHSSEEEVELSEEDHGEEGELLIIPKIKKPYDKNFKVTWSPVTSATFASGDKVVSGSDDRTVKVWDLKNMRSPLTTIRLDSPVNRLAVSKSTIYCIPHDNRHVRLFDLNGVRLARLPRSNRQGHRRMVCSVAWSEDGRNLFSCGFDRLVFGWRITIPTKDDTKISVTKAGKE